MKGCRTLSYWIFLGYDLIEWLMDRLCIEDSCEYILDLKYQFSTSFGSFFLNLH